MPSLGGASAGDDVRGGASQDHGGGGNGGAGGLNLRDPAESRQELQDTMSRLGIRGLDDRDTWGERSRQVLKERRYNLMDPELYGDLSAAMTGLARERHAEAAAKQNRAVAYAQKQRFANTTEAQAREAVDRIQEARLAGNKADMSDISLAGYHGLLDADYGASLVNEHIDRGILGSAWDAITAREDEVGRGYARALSASEFTKRAKAGSLDTAVSGLSKGHLQTSQAGDLVPDRWGQLTTITAPITTPLALAGGGAVAGKAVGGLYGKVAELAATEMATDMTTPTLDYMTAAEAAYNEDYAGAASALFGPIGQAFSEATDIESMNRSLGYASDDIESASQYSDGTEAAGVFGAPPTMADSTTEERKSWGILPSNFVKFDPYYGINFGYKYV